MYLLRIFKLKAIVTHQVNGGFLTSFLNFFRALLYVRIPELSSHRRILWMSALGSSILFSACQPRSTAWSPGQSFRTQILDARSTEASFKTVELEGVMHRGTLSGQTVEFFYSPGDANGTIVGNRPLARFIEDDGVFIPADQISLQMVTIYYHLQQLKKLETQALGRDYSLLPWPRKVALSVRVLSSPELRFNNAFYNSRTDALYYVPYTEQSVPIPLNPGIVAHEHFHALFSQLVLKPLTEKKVIPQVFETAEVTSKQRNMNELYNLYVLRILNEGLADAWGWVYSEDPDFVALSLPKAGDSRDLSKANAGLGAKLKSEQALKNEIRYILFECGGQSSRCLVDSSYLYGTTLARTLKAFAYARQRESKLNAAQVKLTMAREILKLVSAVQNRYASQGKVSLDEVLQIWVNQFQSVSETECAVVQSSSSSSGAVKCNSQE